MASVSSEEIDDQIKDIIHNLYSIIIQNYNYHGPQSANAMSLEVKTLVQNLVTLTRSARSLKIVVPPEVIDYIENGRNPDIYTREFVEIVQRDNQQLKGISDNFAHFRDILARDIVASVPELKPSVEAVTELTRNH